MKYYVYFRNKKLDVLPVNEEVANFIKTCREARQDFEINGDWYAYTSIDAILVEKKNVGEKQGLPMLNASGQNTVSQKTIEAMTRDLQARGFNVKSKHQRDKPN